MPDKVFSVTGDKISSFITDENSLKFSGKKFYTIDAFQEEWDKKLSLAGKFEVKYDSITSITKEDKDKEIKINYKTWAGIPTNCEFSFTDINDYEVFFRFIVKERYFTRIQETLSPFKAMRNYMIGLIVTIGFTIFTYYQALSVANGTAVEPASSKSKLFYYIIGLIGDKGVIAVGALITCFLLYKTWSRFSNPPNRTKFLPPNAA